MQVTGQRAGYRCLAEGMLRKRGRVFWHTRTCRLIQRGGHSTNSLDLYFSNADSLARPVERWKRFPLTARARVMGREDDLTFHIKDRGGGAGAGDESRSIILKAFDAPSFAQWTQAVVTAIAQLRAPVSTPGAVDDESETADATAERTRRELRALGIRPLLVEAALRSLPRDADINEYLDWVAQRIASSSNRNGEEKRADDDDGSAAAAACLPEESDALAPSDDLINFLEPDIDEIVEDDYDSDEGDDGGGDAGRSGGEQKEAGGRPPPPPPPPYSLHATFSQLAGMHDPDQAQRHEDQVGEAGRVRRRRRQGGRSQSVQRRRSLDRRPLSDVSLDRRGARNNRARTSPSTPQPPPFFPDAQVVHISDEGLEQLEQENFNDAVIVACQIRTMPSVPRLSALDLYA